MTERGTILSERRISSEPNLLYHGTSKYRRAHELLAEHGLLADKPTLTPSLEVALGHLGTVGYLTFWYPKDGEVEPIKGNSTLPSAPLLEAEREKIRNSIQNYDMSDAEKAPFLYIASTAKTILPNTRLGAIAIIGHDRKNELERYLPSRDKDFLKNYINKRDELIADIEYPLRDADITFIDPTMNLRKLATDIVRTELEHYLLNIGRWLEWIKGQTPGQDYDKGKKQTEWESKLAELQGVVFEEESYEAYRNELVNAVSGFLGELAA